MRYRRLLTDNLDLRHRDAITVDQINEPSGCLPVTRMPFSPAPDAPLSELIAADVVHRINLGALAPGDRITEQALADQFETSRGPVRDAFKLLQAKGWIELIPRIGARVAPLDAPPAFESILIGGAMLGIAYRLAVMKATDAEVDRFFALARRVVALGRSSDVDPDAFGRAAIEAGNYAIAIADNRRIDDVVGPVPQGALSGFIPMGVRNTQAVEEATQLWVALATAFRMRDAEAAERLGRKMTEASYRRILEHELAPDKVPAPEVPEAGRPDDRD